MQSIFTLVAGLACLVVSTLAFVNLRPRDGQPAIQWMENDGAATAVTLGVMALIVTGIGLIISAVAA